ncbi:MAG: 30S ribosome-binding factor RbfA [Alphaproteobacteria bacterium]|nr:30S ribosome-binding factor RbfA [Alphaproteobacteria bacterium]
MDNRISKKRGPSQRQLRAGEVIRHVLVEILHRENLREPELRGVSITVSEVRISPDLKQASVYAAPLGGGQQSEVIKALNKIAPFLRGLLGKKIDLKFTPTLKFMSDDTFAEAQRIDALLARPEVARDLPED